MDGLGPLVSPFERASVTRRNEPARAGTAPNGSGDDSCLYAQLERGRPFAVEGAGRRIEVRFDQRFPFAQVYTPPRAPFICIEPITAPTNALRSGEDLPISRASFIATWTIRVGDESV
jgi:aldose 1-epimerase